MTWTRHSAVWLACIALGATACDEQPAIPVPSPSTTQASATQAAQQWSRIPLIAVPLSAEVPEGWAVRSGPAGKIVLNGQTPSGEVDILLASRDRIGADSLPAMLSKLNESSSERVKHRVADRDGMKIIEQLEQIGPRNQPADIAPIRWTLQFVILGDGLSYPIYELNVANLSQVSFERDEALLRRILDSVQYDAESATR